MSEWTITYVVVVEANDRDEALQEARSLIQNPSFEPLGAEVWSDPEEDERRDRIFEAIYTTTRERDAAAIEENNLDPRGDDRCANECVCTLTEKIESDAIEDYTALADLVEERPGLMEAAGITADDLDFLRANDPGFS